MQIQYIVNKKSFNYQTRAANAIKNKQEQLIRKAFSQNTNILAGMVECDSVEKSNKMVNISDFHKEPKSY